MKSVFIPYRQEDHGDFDTEWPIHKGVSRWWYITGYLSDLEEPDRMYSYQFTVIKPRVYGISPFILQLAMTDIQKREHHFRQMIKFWNKDVYVNKDTVNYMSLARLERQSDRMLVHAQTEQFKFDLELQKGKGAFWHGDNGVLIMGNPQKPVERTVYYSYTNMPTTGQVTLDLTGSEKRTLQVSGKSWFDRQWGPYHLIDTYTHWEWFSIRFFDDEEVMLFAFPQCPYYDGTYITHDGQTRLVRDYSYTPIDYIEARGMQFTSGWDLFMPGVKEEQYQLRPVIEGQLNLAYFELLAEVINPKGERVGYCVVELLPGARNPEKRVGLDLFRKV